MKTANPRIPSPFDTAGILAGFGLLLFGLRGGETD